MRKRKRSPEKDQAVIKRKKQPAKHLETSLKFQSSREFLDFVRDIIKKSRRTKRQEYLHLQSQITAAAHYYLHHSKNLNISLIATVHLANQLSKGSSHECKTACAELISSCDINKLGCYLQYLKSFALLADACRKWANPDDGNCFQETVKQIARYLFEHGVTGSEPWHLAMLANAFSKLSDAKEDPCFKNAVKIIAKQLASRSDLKNFTPQDLAMLANAYSKWSDAKEDSCFKNAVKRLPNS